MNRHCFVLHMNLVHGFYPKHRSLMFAQRKQDWTIMHIESFDNLRSKIWKNSIEDFDFREIYLKGLYKVLGKII